MEERSDSSFLRCKVSHHYSRKHEKSHLKKNKEGEMACKTAATTGSELEGP